MYARLVLFLSVVACAGVPAEQGPEPQRDPGRPTVDLNLGNTLAEVGGVPVGSREFVQVASRRVPEDGKSLSKDEKLEILDDLVDQKALYLEAKRQGIDNDPKVQRQMIQILLRQTVYSQVKATDFSDEELKTYFEDHRDEFVIPAKARVRRILVKGEPMRSMAEAQGLVQEAAATIGGDIDRFADVAREVSEGPFADRGGDVGLISPAGRSGMSPEEVERAFQLQIGEVSAPFEANGGWNIVAVVTRRDRVERTFEQVRGAVLRRAKADRHQALYEETVANLRAELDVQINPEAIDDLTIAAPQRARGLRGQLPPKALREVPSANPRVVPTPPAPPADGETP